MHAFSPPPVDAQTLDSWLVIAIMPVTSVLTLVVQGLLNRRSKKTETEVAKQNSRVSEMDVAFDGLTSNINAMSDQLKEMRSELKDTKGELRDARADARRTQDELNATRSDLRRLETQVSDLRVERIHFLSHITVLEGLVPNPPGPPARPVWMTIDQTETY